VRGLHQKNSDVLTVFERADARGFSLTLAPLNSILSTSFIGDYGVMVSRLSGTAAQRRKHESLGENRS
jgi:hypothetical protein